MNNVLNLTYDSTGRLIKYQNNIIKLDFSERQHARTV